MSGAERLTRAQRACLLRAVRKELERLTDDLERLMVNSAPDAEIEAASVEIQCVQSAIRWLWKDQRADDG